MLEEIDNYKNNLRNLQQQCNGLKQARPLAEVPTFIKRSKKYLELEVLS
jgi:hypothetical protein